MTTHDDLHRDLGRMEGAFGAMEDRLDKLEKMMSDGFQKLDERLARIESRESERKGAFQLGNWLAVALWKGGEEAEKMKQQILAVKNQYPKPS